MKSISKIKQIIFVNIAVVLGSNILMAQTDSIYYPIEKVIINKQFSSKTKNIQTQSADWLNHDAGSFLTSVPEFSGVRKSGNYSTDPVFRGFKYEQLNIIADGSQNAIQACPGRMDPPISQINMNQIEKVEIYKGPYFFRYGSSVGATVNFVSFKPEFSRSFKIKGRFSTAYESNGNVLRNEVLANLSTKKITSQFFGAYQQGEDYKDGNGNKVPAEFERYNFGNKTIYAWNSNHYTTFQINANQGRNTDFPALTMKMLYDKTWMFQLMHHSEFQNSLLKEFNFSSYSSTVHHSMGTENRSMVSDVSSGTYGLRGELKFEKGKHLLYTGLDYKNERAKNTALTMTMMGGMTMMRDGTSWQDSKISQVGWFNEYQYAWDRFRLRISYRMDYNTADAAETSSVFKKLYGKTNSDNLNNNISAGFEKRIGKQSQISLWIGRAQRSASLTERFINRFPVGNDSYDYLGNPLLKPETNNQADLIYTFGNNKKLYFQVNVFYSLLEYYISGVLRTDIITGSIMMPVAIRQFQNIDEAFKTGFESQMNWQISKILRSELAVAYTYAEDKSTKNPLPEIAPLDLRWNLKADFNPFFAVISYRFAGKQDRINPGFSEMRTPDFSLVDLHFGYKLQNFGRFGIDINNLFNRSYSEYLNRRLMNNNLQRILMPGRNIGVTYSYEF